MIKKIIAFTLLSAPVLLNAQGFQVNLQGQAQQGMAGAGTALMQDNSAVFFNPGGMSFLKDNSISGGVTATIAHGQYLDAASSTISKTDNPISTPFTGYAVFGCLDTTKYASHFKFGMGVYTPFGSTAKWEDGWTGRFALTSLKLQSIFFQPTVSWKINNKIGIGGGLVYGQGNVELKEDLPIYSNGTYGNADLTGKAHGWGYNLGVYIKPTDKFSIGLTYRSQVNMNLNNGTATITVPQSVAAQFPSGPFTSSIPLPKVLTLGLAYQVNAKLALALDINYIGWKAYDTLAFNYKNNTPTFPDTKLPRDYKNTFAFRLGGQYHITSKFTARVGVALSLSPIKSGYVTPEVPDANKVNLTAGLGYKVCNRFRIDISYTFENLKRTDNNLALQMNGTYKTYLSAPGISLAYKFNRN
ncbi:MAG: outer membrane protein transport protein [Bacteroidia bacterium]